MKYFQGNLHGMSHGMGNDIGQVRIFHPNVNCSTLKERNNRHF